MNVTGRFGRRSLHDVEEFHAVDRELDFNRPRFDRPRFDLSERVLGAVRDGVSLPPTRDGEASRLAWIGPKRAFDIVVALSIFLVLAPGLLIIALLIKLTSPGPVLFWQDRYGLNGALFKIGKYRTMYVDAGDCSGVSQTRVDDDRVTPIGKVLRRASLDELPQLWNVLRGDMSLVGPRPHVPGMLAGGVLYEDLVPQYFDRVKVLPGVTGLAQVSGYRGSTIDPDAARARISLDLAYVDSQTIWLDLRIILATARREFLSGSGI